MHLLMFLGQGRTQVSWLLVLSSTGSYWSTRVWLGTL